MAVINGEARLDTHQSDIALTGSVRRLARAAAGSFGLSVAQTLVMTLSTILLARLMGVSDYGIYAFVVATVTLLGVPAILGVDRLLVRDLAVLVGAGSHGLARGLLARANQQTFVVAAVLAAAAALVAWLFAGLAVTPALVAFWLGCVALPFLALGRVAQAGLMGLHHVVLGQFPDLLLRPLIMLGLIVVAVVLVGPLLGAPLAVGLYALSMAAACGVAYTLLYTNRPAPMRSAALEFRSRDWLVASISLALLSSTAIINAQTGVVLLGALSTPEAAGLYSVAQRGALLVAFPLAAVNAAIAPTAARLWSAGDRARLQRLVTLSARGVLVASLPIGLAFIVFGRQLLTFLFGAEFAAADDSLVILSVGQLANAATGSVAVLLVMSGHQRRATVALASGAVLNVIIGIALIPGLAETGAAIAAATSLIVSNLLMAFDARRTMGLDSTALGWIRRTEASA